MEPYYNSNTTRPKRIYYALTNKLASVAIRVEKCRPRSRLKCHVSLAQRANLPTKPAADVLPAKKYGRRSQRPLLNFITCVSYVTFICIQVFFSQLLEENGFFDRCVRHIWRYRLRHHGN